MKRMTVAMFLLAALTLIGSPALAAPGCGTVPEAAGAAAQAPSTADLLAQILDVPLAAPQVEPVAEPLATGPDQPAFCHNICCYTDDDCFKDCPLQRKCVRFGSQCGRCEYR